MGKLTAKSLYPHLTDVEINESELFTKNYNYDNNVTESDRLLEKKIK